jgi:hypothetical protein
VYLDLVRSFLFSTVQQVVLFGLFQSRFLHVCHFHVQRSRSPIYIERKMAYNIKENREEEKKNSDRKRETGWIKHTPYFCLVRHVLMIKKRMRKERKKNTINPYVR